jgi:integrase
MVLRDMTIHALHADRRSIALYVQGERAGIPQPDVEKTVKLLTGKLTPFGSYLDTCPPPKAGDPPADGWAKVVKVARKTRDEYRSGIEEFMRRVDAPLETLTVDQVQVWVDYLLSDDDGLDAKTVNKKLSGLHNYWTWMGKRGLVKDYRTRQPFRTLDVQNPFGKVKIAPERYDPADVVRLWEAAEGDLGEMIRIAAYTGARRESVVGLRIPDIKTDQVTKVRFMHMTGKTEAGDRDVPVHPAISALIDRRIREAGSDGYLFHSASGNQYGIRGTGAGKQFAALKTRLGFGPAHDFHSLRRTFIHLCEVANVPEGVTQDIVGHKKLSLTYGTYSGKTPIDQRAAWMEQALHYPNGQSSAAATS